MSRVNRWHLIHDYQKLNEKKRVPDLECPEGHKVWPVIDTESDDPAFYCGPCGVTIFPGINVWDQIEAEVRDHNDDD